MIRVEVYRDTKGQLTGFSVKGHSRFAQSGLDIVCSAVSALTLAAAMGLSEIAEKAVDGKQEEGHLRCILTEEADTKTEMILATMLLGLQEIQKQYPKNIKIIDS